MSEAAVRLSRPEELPRVAAVLAHHGEELERIGKSVSVARRRGLDQARAAVDQLRGRVAAAQQQWSNADERDKPAAEKRLEAAMAALSEGVRQQRRIETVFGDLEQRAGQHVRTGRDLAEQGRRGLQRFWERLDRASSAFASAVARHRSQPRAPDPRRIVGGRADGRGSAPSTQESGVLDDFVDRLLGDVRDQLVEDVRDAIVDEVAEVGREALPCRYPSVGATDRVLVPIEDLFDPGPVTGPGDFGTVTLSEMLDGLRVLEEQVLPAVREGCGRDELRRRDDAAGTSESPASLLRVHDAFFGDEEHAIRVTREPGGRLRLDAGRHRLFAARRAHLDVLPVLLREPS